MTEPIPLSVIALDLPTPPLGWEVELDARGVSVFTDDVGRLAISRDAARQLLAEHREEEARKARLRSEIEQRAIDADQAFRASLPAGIPAGAVPDGITAAQLMMLSDPMQGSRRETVLEHALRHRDGAIVYHSVEGAASGGGES